MGFEQSEECMFCYLLNNEHHQTHDKCGGQCHTPCTEKGDKVTICRSCISNLNGSERVLQKLTRNYRSMDMCHVCDCKIKCYPILTCTEHYKNIDRHFEAPKDLPPARPDLPPSDLYPDSDQEASSSHTSYI